MMERNDPLKHSRYKRLPQVWRIGQDAPRAVDSLGDEFRVTVFLTNQQADRAEKEAIQAGLGDLQNWCQATLRQAINLLDDEARQPMTPVVRSRPQASPGEIVAEMDLPDDPDFYRELAGIEDDATDNDAGKLTRQLPGDSLPADSLPAAREPARPMKPGTDLTLFADALERVLAALRNAGRPQEVDVSMVSSTLESLAAGHAEEDHLPRDLVRLVYRLAMESQVLITEVHPRLGLDLTVITAVRRMQAAAGRLIDQG
jgi:hypothetical protein